MTKKKQNNLKRPLYVDVYDELLLQITNGTYPVGSRLPSEPELATNMGVSRSTLRQALALLQDDGLVSNIHGKGNFVIASFYKKEDEVTLGELSNPMHKCHISEFDQIDIQYVLDEDTEYTKQVLGRDSSKVIAVDRMYRRGNHLIGYAFTFMSLEAAKEFNLDLDNKAQVFEFLENQCYTSSIRGEIEIKHTNTVSLPDQEEKLIGQNNCFLIMESIYGDSDYPLMFNKFYIPQQFAKIKLNIYK